MQNLREILLMIAAMAGLATADVFIKLVTAELPLGQVMLFLGSSGAVFFAILARANGETMLSRDLLSSPVMIRNVAEVVGTFGFMMAITHTALSSASAILQAMPLAITLGAVLFLGETVGWRRWMAIAVGFGGVLMIIRPGLDGFEPASLFAVLAVLGLAARDLATRATTGRLSSMVLASYGFAMLLPAGLLMTVTGAGLIIPSPTAGLQLLGGFLASILGYYAITAAMRTGAVSVVSPFRYSRLIFALAFGFWVFGERPDVLTLGGAVLIILSGLYALLRERQHSQ